MTRYFYKDPLAAYYCLTPAQWLLLSLGNNGVYMPTIIMTDGTSVLVSDQDYQWLSAFKWRPSASKKKIYAKTSVKRDKWRNDYMHRMIVKPPAGMQVDHINGNSLDNRRENLRLCDSYKNAHNRGKNVGVKYKGVRKEGDTFRMTISKTYHSAEEAAKAYNELAKILFGEFAFQNEAA